MFLGQNLNCFRSIKKLRFFNRGNNHARAILKKKLIEIRDVKILSRRRKVRIRRMSARFGLKNQPNPTLLMSKYG